VEEFTSDAVETFLFNCFDNCRQLGYHTAISADIAHLWPLGDLALYKCP